MSLGKKWKMTKKQIHRNNPHRHGNFKVGGGRNGKFRFKFFRHQKDFKYLDGRVSMRWIMVRNCWYWD